MELNMFILVQTFLWNLFIFYNAHFPWAFWISPLCLTGFRVFLRQSKLTSESHYPRALKFPPMLCVGRGCVALYKWPNVPCRGAPSSCTHQDCGIAKRMNKETSRTQWPGNSLTWICPSALTKEKDQRGRVDFPTNGSGAAGHPQAKKKSV